MEQSPWEPNRFSASQEIPHVLWNPKVYYRFHNCPPLVTVDDNFRQSNKIWLEFWSGSYYSSRNKTRYAWNKS